MRRGRRVTVNFHPDEDLAVHDALEPLLAAVFEQVADQGAPEATLQHLEYLWHILVLLGRPPARG